MKSTENVDRDHGLHRTGIIQIIMASSRKPCIARLAESSVFPQAVHYGVNLRRYIRTHCTRREILEERQPFGAARLQRHRFQHSGLQRRACYRSYADSVISNDASFIAEKIPLAGHPYNRRSSVHRVVRIYSKHRNRSIGKAIPSLYRRRRTQNGVHNIRTPGASPAARS
jgi:hypothetical protein